MSNLDTLTHAVVGTLFARPPDEELPSEEDPMDEPGPPPNDPYDPQVDRRSAAVPDDTPADEYPDVPAGPGEPTYAVCADPDVPDPAPPPWDGPCRNCGGAHHVQRCPEVLALLFAPLTGADIARAWHRDYRGFARRIWRATARDRVHAASLYTRYMAERLPRQRYALSVENTLVAWHRAARL